MNGLTGTRASLSTQEEARQLRIKSFQTLSEEAIWKALEGHENVLAKAEEESRKFFERLVCPYPNCRGRVTRKVNEKQPFREGELLANFLGMCVKCGCEFEPYTGIILSLQHPARVG